MFSGIFQTKLTVKVLRTTKVGFYLSYYLIKALLLGIKGVFKQKYLQMFGLKSNKYE